MKRWLLLPLLLLAACANPGSGSVTEPENETVPESNSDPSASEEAQEPEKETENEQPPEPQQEEKPAEEIAVELNIPWAINKAGEEFYISERPGTVAHVLADGTVKRQQVNFDYPLSSASEAGFLGFVLKPDFTESRQAYGYYVFEENGMSYNRLVTLTLQKDVWEETDVHLQEISTGIVHHGGRLEFSPEGDLFVSIGDAYNPDLAQDQDSLNGKILRMNRSGEINVHSSGHRNPQGFAWHEGVMYAAEHGQSANDEVNVIEKGANYGWPLIEGTESEEGLKSPFFTTGPSETWAPSGIAAHDGLLYVASLRGTAVNIIDLETGEALKPIEGYGRIRDVQIDGDNLYFITNNTDGRGSPNANDDRLVRISLNN